MNPQIFKICYETFKKSKIDLDFQRLDSKSLIDCPNISLDVAVMEKTKNGIVLPLDAEWSDIGSWKSVWENSKKDINGNVNNGNVFSKETENCYLLSENKLLVSLGIKDLIVIDTDDVTLVANKNNSQDVKQIVDDLKKLNLKEAVNTRKGYRPWGFYISVIEDTRWQVKIIHVKPGAKLSLQKHHHRAEHWIVVKGTAEVEIENDKSVLTESI